MRRRSFLKTSLLAASKLSGQQTALPSRKKLAAIAVDYRVHSNADDVITRFLEGFWINDEYHRSSCDIASLYLEQKGTADIGTRLASAYRIPLLPSIADALTLGTRKLAVDGVLLVGEDEDAPDSRFELFTKIVAVFRQTGRSVPVFCAGYLSRSWDHAREMYRQARELNFPLMAGSSETAAFRRPELEYPLPSGFDDAPLGDRAHHDYKLGVEFDGALVISPGTFSGIEILQSFLERRRGGETGIQSVECLAGPVVWRAAERELLDAALERAESRAKGRPENFENPVLWLIQYRDGTRAALLSLGDYVGESVAAFRVRGRREIDSTLCFAPAGSRNDFSKLVQGVSQMMMTGNCPYPVERSLLATGALWFLKEARRLGQRIETPTLEIGYAPPERSFYAQGRGW